MKRISKLVGLAMVTLTLCPPDAGAQVRDDRGDRVVVRGDRGWIGISFESDRSGAAEVAVTEVVPGAPAERAGVRTGDAIVRWNGSSDVVAAVDRANLEAGDTVRLRVRRAGAPDRDIVIEAERRPFTVALPGPRSGRRVIVIDPEIDRHLRVMSDSMSVYVDSISRSVRVLLDENLRPELRRVEREMREISLDSIFEQASLAMSLSINRRGVAGAELSDLGDGLASYFDVEEGALVLRVAPGTPASRAGIQEGDVIVRAAGEPVASVRELRSALEDVDRDVEIEVVRRGNRHILVLPE